MLLMDETGSQLSRCFEENIKVDSLNSLNVGICRFMASRNDDQTFNKPNKPDDREAEATLGDSCLSATVRACVGRTPV